MDLQTRVEQMVNEIDSANAEYILQSHKLNNEIEIAQRFQAKNEEGIVENIMRTIEKYIREYNDKNLTPANVKVGEGATMALWSDAHAGTIVKVTKTTVTVQRDIATLVPEFKPEFYVGGFAGHCHNQNEQKYNYERNPEGQLQTFRWSNKYQEYRSKGLRLFKGRHEFYDYNF